MSSRNLLELGLIVALIACVAGIVAVTIISGAVSLPATGLRDLAIAIAAGLLGSKVPQP